jgi:tetratricopeptide (TPR) repeat protein
MCGLFSKSGTVRTFVVALLLAFASQAVGTGQTFETCAASVAARPVEYEPYRCYYEVAAASGEWQTAGKHLARLAAKDPHIDWIVFVRAAVTSSTDSNAAERLYLEAARRFEAAGNVRGEVLARQNLQSMFYQSGRIASAAQQVERVTSLAERTEDAEIRTRARVVEAQFYIATGTNLGRAQRALQQAEADLEAVPAYWLRRLVLQNSGSLLLLLGEHDQAVAYFRGARRGQHRQCVGREAQ